MRTLFITMFMTMVAWGQTWESGATAVTLSGRTLTVSGKGAMGDYDAIEAWPQAPWWGSDSVVSVVVEDGVTSIGDGAFAGFINLSFITIGNSVKTIGERAFMSCFALISITIPYGVMSIGVGAFYNCKALVSVSIPNSVITIGHRVFSLTALTSITIPHGVRTIEGTAFISCTSLTSINVAVDNENYSSEDGVLFNKNKTVLVAYPAGRQGAYIIPRSVTEIGDYAFSRSNGLTSVTIPGGVRTIGKYAFELPSRLTSIISLNPVPPNIGGRGVFTDLRSSACLYVPENSIDAYRSANGWDEFECVKDLTLAPRCE
jgi:hypothetical protein